jgi:hypothetical protein
MMKQYLTNCLKQCIFLSALFITLTSQAQTPATCNANNCTDYSSIFTCPSGSTATTGLLLTPTQKTGNPCSNGLCEKSIWRYASIASQGTITVNAEIKITNITNAIIENIDDDVNIVGGTYLFAPRIKPDIDLNTVTERKGWVEFEVKFYDAGSGGGYSNLINLEHINLILFDIDGSGNSTDWFREIVHIKKANSPSNPTIHNYSGSELTNNSYVENSITWNGFTGSACDRTGLGLCAEVAGQATFSSPQNSISFRLGYDSKNNGGIINQTTREYGIKLSCFNIPTATNLPVNMTNLTLNKIQNNKILVTWQTLTETNCVGFEVQKSKNGGNDFVSFANISSQSPNGNSNNKLNYEIIDTEDNNGTIFYRIMQKDLSGRLTYSDIKSIKTNGSQQIVIYPNPSIDGNVVVKIPNTMIGTTGILKSANGATVFSQKIENTILKMSNLPTGFYLFSIVNKSNENIITQRIIVQ